MQTWVEFPLTKGKVALVDVADLLVLARYRWKASLLGRHWYAERSVHVGGKRKNERMHRWIMQPPPGLVVDHINHDTLDNRRSNLRIATVSQNTANRRHTRPSMSRGKYVGICQPVDNRPGRDGRPCRWRADCQGRYIGSFDTPEEAARAYDAVAREVFGEFAMLNFPDALAAGRGAR